MEVWGRGDTPLQPPDGGQAAVLPCNSEHILPMTVRSRDPLDRGGQMEGVLTIVPLVLAAALIKKVVDLIRYAKARDVNGVVTQVIVFAAGVGVAVLFRASDYFSKLFVVNDVTLADIDPAGVVIVGLALGAAASVVNDLVSSNGDTPKLME